MSAMADEKQGISELPMNFTISTPERMRALAMGPPAYARRLRRIEDLTAAVIKGVAEFEAKEGVALTAASLPLKLSRQVALINKLIEDHNQYYPIEAGLRIDLRTRHLMDWGEPWEPTPPVEAEALIAAARER